MDCVVFECYRRTVRSRVCPEGTEHPGSESDPEDQQTSWCLLARRRSASCTSRSWDVWDTAPSVCPLQRLCSDTFADVPRWVNRTCWCVAAGSTGTITALNYICLWFEPRCQKTGSEHGAGQTVSSPSQHWIWLVLKETVFRSETLFLLWL